MTMTQDGRDIPSSTGGLTAEDGGETHHFRLARRSNTIILIALTPVAIALLAGWIWLITVVEFKPRSLSYWTSFALFATAPMITLLAWLRMAQLALQGDRIVLTLSPAGCHDHRRTAQPIPWSDITHARIAFGRVVKLCLRLHPAASAQWAAQGLKAAPRWSLHSGLICLRLRELDLDTDELETLIKGFRAAYGKGASGSGSAQ
ncbi:MAG: hypothetical protein EA339_00395 [Rhodobacteraceae bacterium]|nr:MAG: hypothetical protein EA339_00395 [Paracoccaceae bacterium]